MLSDFTNHSLKHEFQSAAKNVSFLLVHTFEKTNLGTFPKNYLVIFFFLNVRVYVGDDIKKNKYKESSDGRYFEVK